MDFFVHLSYMFYGGFVLFLGRSTRIPSLWSFKFIKAEGETDFDLTYTTLDSEAGGIVAPVVPCGGLSLSCFDSQDLAYL